MKEKESLTIEVPQGVTPILEKLSIIRGQKPEEIVTEALERFLGRTPPKNEQFVNQRKLSIPENCFILFALPQHEWHKLYEWISKGEHPQVVISSNGEVFLFNEFRLKKWASKHNAP